MKIDYLLTGIMNGAYIELHGTGSVDINSGNASMELTNVNAPKGWDPASIILICCDNLRLMTAKCGDASQLKELQKSIKTLHIGNEVNDQRHGVIRDDQGNIIVNIKAKGWLFVKENVFISRTVINEGISKFDNFGGIKEIRTPYHEIIVPAGKGEARGISSYTIECTDGSILTGNTYYPYHFDRHIDLRQQQTLTISIAKVNSIEYHQTGATPKIELQISGT